MIGLHYLQARLYAACIQHIADTTMAPRLSDIRWAFGKSGQVAINRALSICLRRGFILKGRTGTLHPQTPTHERVIASVLAKTSITSEQLLGTTKEQRVVALRKVVAKILRQDFGYGFRAIGAALNKNHRTVDEWFKPVRCAARSARRKAKYEARKAA